MDVTEVWSCRLCVRACGVELTTEVWCSANVSDTVNKACLGVIKGSGGPVEVAFHRCEGLDDLRVLVR